jgi:hypothetical protein
MPADFFQKTQLGHGTHITEQSHASQVGNTLRNQLSTKAVERHTNDTSQRLVLLRFSAIVLQHFRSSRRGAEMNKRTRKQDPLVEIVRSQQEEIKKYKWIESEKHGHDIGWERATREWMQKHFPEWKRFRWDRAIQEALRDQMAEPAGVSGLN